MTRTEEISINVTDMNNYVTELKDSSEARLARLKYEIFADRAAAWRRQSLLLFSKDVY